MPRSPLVQELCLSFPVMLSANGVPVARPLLDLVCLDAMHVLCYTIPCSATVWVRCGLGFGSLGVGSGAWDLGRGVGD